MKEFFLKAFGWAKRHKALTIVGTFVLWMLFFDRNSVIMHLERDRNIAVLKDSINLYKKKIEKQQILLEHLRTDPKALERYARERYGLKREDEDVFIIQQD